MTKILKKDIENICNCIQNISWEYIKENNLHCFNHNIISWYNVEPYTCKEVKFYFYKGSYKIELTANNKKDMYVKLLKLYEKGLNNWIETFEKDSYKTKKERYRLNGYKKKLIELKKVVDICCS
jgi:hypothetical protein